MIAVLGGGISGLSVAYFLAQQGESVVLYEQKDRLGGACNWVQLGDSRVDSFYHVLTGGENFLRRLIRAVGLEHALFPITITQGFFQDGRISPASGLQDLLRFPALSPADRFRLARTIIQAKFTRDWSTLDTKTAREWLIEVGGPNLYERFWQPIMTCKFGSVIDRVVATDMWFRIHRLGSVTLSRNGSGPCYLRGTLRTLFDALDEKLVTMGVEVHKSTPIRCLNITDNRIDSVEVGEGETVSADRVISTLPLPALAKLLPENLAEFRAALTRIDYLHNICLIMKTSRPISPYYQLNLGHADFPFTGVIAADCMYPPAEYDGHITYIPRYFQGTTEPFGTSEEELLGQYAPYIRKICPDFHESWIDDMVLSRGHNVEPLHTVGYSQLIPSVETPVKGLSLLSTSQIYPEPTILDTAVLNAYQLVESWQRDEDFGSATPP